jgi:hypothetical protein
VLRDHIERFSICRREVYAIGRAVQKHGFEAVDLKRMAEHPVEVRDAEVSAHLTCCSPRFNRYMEILAGLRKTVKPERSL